MQKKRKEGSQTLFNRLEFQEARLQAAAALLKEALVLGATSEEWCKIEAKIKEALTEISRAEILRFTAQKVLTEIGSKGGER